MYILQRRNIKEHPLLSKGIPLEQSIDFRKGKGGRNANAFLSQGCVTNILPVLDVCGESPVAVRINWSPGSSSFCLHGSSGCLGCDTKPKLISTADDPLKGQNSEVWRASKASRSESFFTTSTCEMDNSNASLHGSISLTHDTHGASTSVKPSEFVNHGLLLWNQSRQKWIGTKKPENRSQQLLEPKLSWNATYDSLLNSNKPFRKPIPLGEMVDFLVDIWEQEGMYD